MPVQKLKSFLDEHSVKYVTINHSRAFTAQEVAASAHIPGKELAKVVIIKIGDKMAMAVLPASYKVDFDQLRRALGTEDVELARERDFKELFPDCDVGAMPPFGNLYDMDVYVAQSLREDEEIAFSAGTHSELIRLSYSDFERLVKPSVLQFSVQEHAEA